jgi:hypothetical protein
VNAHLWSLYKQIESEEKAGACLGSQSGGATDLES